MKRSFEDEQDCAAGVAVMPPTHAAAAGPDKRSRSGSPPMAVGPLIFNAEGTALQPTLFEARPSSLPGVHRLAAPASAVVRVWLPQRPLAEFLEAPLQAVLQAIDAKCIFVFDTRASPLEPLLAGVTSRGALLAHPAVRRFGILVSPHAPPQGEHLASVLVQDPAGALGALCNHRLYLGPTAVLVKNSEVVATMMLSRVPAVVQRTLDEWSAL